MASNRPVLKADFSDVADIVSLNKALSLSIPGFFWDTPEWIEQEVRKGNYYVVRDEGDTAVGAMCLRTYLEKNAAVIEAVAVRRDFQKSGIGSAFVCYAKERCLEQSLSELSVESFQSYGVQDFYQRCGFDLLPQTGTFHGHEYNKFTMSLTK